MVYYVTELGTIVGVKRARLEVRKGGRTLDSVRLADLQGLVLCGPIQLTTQAMRALLKRGIETCLLSQSGTFLGRLSGGLRKNIALRQLQFRRLDERERALSLARRFVKGKLHNQRALLLRYQRRLRLESIAQALIGIRLLLDELPHVEDLDVLRGMEGRAAALYFGVFGLLFSAPGISFERRLRRPPPDPVNILLSFGYTLLGHLIQGCAELASLDPYLGAFHQIHYGRPSLALDLLEEWRPTIVDAAVVSAFNTRALQPQHFVPLDCEDSDDEDVWDIDEDQATATSTATLPSPDEEEEEPPPPRRELLLTPEGSKRWFAVYERRLNEEAYYPPQQRYLSYRQIIREQVYLFARHLRDEDSYHPFLYSG